LKKRFPLAIGRLLAGPGLPSVAAAEPRNDHPRLTRCEGSTLASRKVEGFAEYRIVTGVSDRGQFSGDVQGANLR